MVFKDDRAALTELLTVKFHGNNSMKEHNYALQNTNTCPRLQIKGECKTYVLLSQFLLLF